MTDLDVRSVPIRRSIQHRQPNLIQPTPQMISKQSNYQQYEEVTLTKARQINYGLECPTITAKRHKSNLWVA